MNNDFDLDDTDGPDRDGDYWREEADVLIAEVTHTCCGATQAYYNCNSEDVPGPERICRDCLPRVERNPDEFFDPFSGERV